MSSPPNRRRSRRLPPCGRGNVTCRAGALDLGPNLALALLDLCESGACLVVRAPLAAGQEVSLTFEAAGSGRRCARRAEVVWCR
jgi:hypothetical protein